MRRTLYRLGLVGLAMLAAASPSRAADLATFFPKETDAIVSVNIRQLVDSEVIKKYALEAFKKSLNASDEAQKLLDALGLDPLRDFERVTFGGGGEDATTAKAVIVIEGKFDPAKINGAAGDIARRRGQNVSLDKIDGKTVYKLSSENQPQPMYAAVMDKNLIVMATSKELMTTCFDAAEGNKRSELRRDLSTLLSKAETRASMFMVAATKGKLDRVPIPDQNVKKVIEGVESLSIELRVEKDVKLQLAVGVEDDEAAKVLQEMIDSGLEQLKQFVPLLALQNPRMKPLGDVVKNIKSATKGKLVIVNAAIPSDALDKLIKEAKSDD